MVDLTPTNAQAAGEAGGIITSEQPRSTVTPQQVAQPYNDLSQALSKSGEALGTIAEEAAKQAGLKAVTRDAQGNLHVETAPIIGPASQAYSRAVKFAALSSADADAKQQDIVLREKYHDDPQTYLAAANTYRDTKVKQYSDMLGPEFGISVGNSINASTTQTFKGLQNEHERLTLQRADASITAGINSAKDDALALARGGDTQSPAFVQAVSKIQTLTQEKVANPRLAYPPEAAAYDLDQLQGHLKGQGFLYHVDQVYKDQGVNEDGSPKGGAANALEAAKQVLTDPSIKLTEAQRQQYFTKATAEVRANEALRRQDISEARAYSSNLMSQSAMGMPVLPEEVERAAQMHRDAGDPAGAARLYATFARRPLNDDFGKQPLDQQTAQVNALRTGIGMATSHAEANLIQHESGGNPTLVNKLGYAGMYQFGAPLLKDLGIYKPGAGENVGDPNAPGQWSGQKWSGQFNVPGFPEVKNLKDFLGNPAAQKAAFDLHVQGMDAAIVANGMDRFIGQKIGGVPITLDGLHAMIHLGGVKGTMQTLASNGAINPSDANGTSLLDYARVGANNAAPNPATSMWLQANHSTVLQKNAREAFSTVVSDYQKDSIRPADTTINQITNAARATNDHALLEGIAQFSDKLNVTQQQSQQPLPAQHATITALQTAGANGDLSPGQAGVLKDLQRRNDAITKGLKDNPIATTVQNFSDKFDAPAPLDLKNPDNLVAGLQQRGRIAQFAQQNWQTGPVSALDSADLKQVTAALDTPDVATKAGIFAAIARLPEDVRNATLAKIGEKRPDFMVAAAAGSMLQQAPDVAQSILRGQEAIKADKGYLPVKTEADSLTQELDKALPASTFSLAARTTDNGPYEVARGMIKARYADLSAQNADTSGKLNSQRLKDATADVTGGVLSMNGGTFIAPRRGMSQKDFDGTMWGVTDNDMAGATTLNGQPVTADYLRNNAQLESIGAGRYQIRLGKDPMRPVYAYQGANTETPQKFILDLRNRPMGPQPTAMLGDVGASP